VKGRPASAIGSSSARAAAALARALHQDLESGTVKPRRTSVQADDFHLATAEGPRDQAQLPTLGRGEADFDRVRMVRVFQHPDLEADFHPGLRRFSQGGKKRFVGQRPAHQPQRERAVGALLGEGGRIRTGGVKRQYRLPRCAAQNRARHAGQVNARRVRA